MFIKSSLISQCTSFIVFQNKTKGAVRGLWRRQILGCLLFFFTRKSKRDEISGTLGLCHLGFPLLGCDEVMVSLHTQGLYLYILHISKTSGFRLDLGISKVYSSLVNSANLRSMSFPQFTPGGKQWWWIHSTLQKVSGSKCDRTEFRDRTEFTPCKPNCSPTVGLHGMPTWHRDKIPPQTIPYTHELH